MTFREYQKLAARTIRFDYEKGCLGHKKGSVKYDK